MKPIKSIIEPYIELERAIRERMGDLFGETCGTCTACCCRADICEESTQSAFLSLLLEDQELSADDMDDRYGWLDLHGCSLSYGRPPVCYTFFCSELLARLPDEDTRLMVRVLGRLIEFVGENALKGWHLVEIEDAADLEQIDTDALMERLEHAQDVFHVIEQFFETGRLSADDRVKIEAIPLDDS